MCFACEKQLNSDDRYIAEARDTLERLSWLLVLAASFSCAAVLVNRSLQEATENPIVTAVDSVPVQQLYYPAITLRTDRADYFVR